jgi:hypothetical protein
MNTRVRLLGIIILINLTAGLLIVPQDLGVSQRTDESVGVQVRGDDVSNSALNYANLTSEKEVKLDLERKTIKDDFLNETKIGYKENVMVDTNWDEVVPIIVDRTIDYEKYDKPYAVKQTDDGGFIIVGMAAEHYYLRSDVLLIKIDSHRNEIWSKSFGHSGYNVGYSIQQTKDRGYIIAGYTNSYGAGGEDGWLIKTDRHGTEQWNMTFGGTKDDSFNSVQLAEDGGFIIAGFTESFGNENGSAWLVKTDFSGNIQLNKTYGGNGEDYARSILQTIDGGYIIAGNNVIKTDSLGNEEWNKTIECYDILLTPDNRILLLSDELVGSSGSGSTWSMRTKLIKIDILGNVEWTELYSLNNLDNSCYSFQRTTDGGCIIIGFTFDWYCDILLIKTDSFGKLIWYKTINNLVDLYAGSVTQTSQGKFIIVGYFDTDYLESDMFVMQLNEDGDLDFNSYFISTNLLDSVSNKIKSIDTFSYNTYIFDDDYIELQFSFDNKTWFDSNGILDNSTKITDDNNVIDLFKISKSCSEFYYKIEFPLNAKNYISIENISLSYTFYSREGEFISNPFESKTPTSWKSLKWNSTTPPGTSIKFQLRSANSEFSLSKKQFHGPDGTALTFYSSSPSNISIDHTDDIWIQYKAYCRSSGNDTPILHDVNISYNYIPIPPVVYNFGDDRWYNQSKPIFYWSFNDLDGYQSGYQIYLDDNELFESIDYDSGSQSTSSEIWKFGEGTNFSKLEDGIWYWKMRTRDNRNAWSPFSISSILKIDTEPPMNFIIEPIRNCWISNKQPNIIFETSDRRSGMSHYEVKIDNNSFKKQISPFTLPRMDDGKHTLFVRAYDRAGNYREETVELFIDTRHPETNHGRVYNSKRWENITINLTVIDEHSGVGNVLLFFKNNATESYSAISMAKYNDTYTAVIPANVVTSTISYYFKVKDKSIPSNEIDIDYWGNPAQYEFTPMTIFVPLPIKSIQPEKPDKPDLFFNNIKKDNTSKSADEENGNFLMEKYDNYSPLIFIIIITIFISILWIKVVGADTLLLNPYTRTIRNPRRRSQQFSETLFIYYGEMIKPDNNDKLPPDLLKKIKKNRRPPTPPESIPKNRVLRNKRALVRIRCSICKKSFMGDYSIKTKSRRCPFCNNLYI